MKLFNMASPMFSERDETNMQSTEAANVYNRLYKKQDGGVHEHTIISRVFVVTAAMCFVLSKYLYGLVLISVSEVGLIRKSLLLPLVVTGPGGIIEWSSLLCP
jgi:hypothetical protein